MENLLKETSLVPRLSNCLPLQRMGVGGGSFAGAGGGLDTRLE